MTLELVPQWAPSPARLAALDRTFEAIVFDWDGTAVPDRHADASAVRERIEALSKRSVEVIVVSGTHAGNVDGQLRARPEGPGTLWYALNRGSELFRVGRHGPTLVRRRLASDEEERALDRAAAEIVRALAARGLRTEIVSQRLNRRKIDLIPEREWADPPKARIGELLDAVTRRLRGSGISGLVECVEIALAAARGSGLRDPRITSDAKHVEVGLTDKSDSARAALDMLRTHGIGPGLTLVLGDEFGSLGGLPGSDSMLLINERLTAVSVGVEPEGAPGNVVHVGGGPNRFLALLDDQLERRAQRRAPDIDRDPRWTVTVSGTDGTFQRVHESLLTLSDGHFGTRGAREEDGPNTRPLVVSHGVYERTDDTTNLLPAPVWTALAIRKDAIADERRTLDMRTGILVRDASTLNGPLRTVRAASLARPGTAVLRAEGPPDVLGKSPLFVAPSEGVTFSAGARGGVAFARTVSSIGGGIASAAVEHHEAGSELTIVERIASFRSESEVAPAQDAAADPLLTARAEGFDRLLAEHRRAWAERWDDAEIVIEGDPEMELATRFALFHLLATAPHDAALPVGARGLTGEAYGGHVFWDTDVFMLPAYAATHPEAARRILEYRIASLPAAYALAKRVGRHGARFPWEAGRSGHDVTPRVVHSPLGTPIAILSGPHEEHIVADVAWAAETYARWTGDQTPARILLGDTARYWASRVRFDDVGRAHIYGVMGPDEYHEVVDDNAFTNVMARWNLRAAARYAPEAEARAWREIADALVDGFDRALGRHEQFAGFYALDDVLIADIAPRPCAADVVIGRKRVARSQIVKQADVLMLHHMVPDELPHGSLARDLEYYEPRTAHGSSLSPAIHAALFARAHQPDRALEMFRIAANIDLRDVTGTTAAGLHLATFGGLWQALAHGFAGVHANGRLHVDPVLPDAWRAIELRMRMHGARVRLRCEHDRVAIETDRSVDVAVGHTHVRIPRGMSVFIRTQHGWKERTS